MSTPFNPHNDARDPNRRRADMQRILGDQILDGPIAEDRGDESAFFAVALIIALAIGVYAFADMRSDIGVIRQRVDAATKPCAP